jgi:hypothetical protein
MSRENPPPFDPNDHDNRITESWLKDDEDYQFFKERWAKEKLAKLRVDPRNRDNLAERLGTLITRNSDKAWEDHAGGLFCSVLKDWSAEKAEKLFKRIIKLKEEAEMQGARSYQTLKAYYDFIDEVRRNPSKKALKDYISSRKEKYGAFPSADADEANQWTPIWKAAGLSKLSSR